jgi:hypothetical protein
VLVIHKSENIIHNYVRCDVTRDFIVLAYCDIIPESGYLSFHLLILIVRHRKDILLPTGRAIGHNIK